jgi:hypothetical protein
VIADGEACSETAEIPFDIVLDRVTGSDPSVTYVLEVPARCLQCAGQITEKTLPTKLKSDRRPWVAMTVYFILLLPKN